MRGRDVVDRASDDVDGGSHDGVCGTDCWGGEWRDRDENVRVVWVVGVGVGVLIECEPGGGVVVQPQGEVEEVFGGAEEGAGGEEEWR